MFNKFIIKLGLFLWLLLLLLLYMHYYLYVTFLLSKINKMTVIGTNKESILGVRLRSFWFLDML